MASLTKREARIHGRAQRAALTAVQREANDEALTQNVKRELDWKRYRTVHCFLPIERTREINTWPLIEWIWREHPQIRLYVPRLLGSRLEHVRATMGAALAVNKFGIPEPLEGELLPEGETLDVIFVPLLAVDHAGHRVGYGGGYYDRFLPEFPDALKIGLCYESWVVESITASDHDVTLDGLITQHGRHSFK